MASQQPFTADDFGIYYVLWASIYYSFLDKFSWAGVGWGEAMLKGVMRYMPNFEWIPQGWPIGGLPKGRDGKVLFNI